MQAKTVANRDISLIWDRGRLTPDREGAPP
jgi:hypothetical protein